MALVRKEFKEQEIKCKANYNTLKGINEHFEENHFLETKFQKEIFEEIDDLLQNFEIYYEDKKDKLDRLRPTTCDAGLIQEFKKQKMDFNEHMRYLEGVIVYTIETQAKFADA